MPWLFLGLVAAAVAAHTLLAQEPAAPSAETVSVRLADGFDIPVGRDAMKRYYKARGFRPNGHLGEDWNGAGGGDTDLGDPVYSVAHGIVVFARDYKLGWGNVVIVRHAYLENGATAFVDSLYGHLHTMLVTERQHVTRGEQIGTIGNNRGMYDAHLHFEMRKNLAIGMHRHAYPRDFTTYWDPTQFIAARQTLTASAALAAVPVNTFAATKPPAFAGPADTGPLIRSAPAASPKRTFKVNRFDDLQAK